MPEMIYLAVALILIVGLVIVWRASRSSIQPVEPMDFSSPPVSNASDFSLTIQDTFGIKGRGLVVTGKIERGMIIVGQRVQISSPDGTQRYETEVKGLEAFRKTLNSASAGDNVGILLADLTKDQIKPGMIITSASAF